MLNLFMLVKSQDGTGKGEQWEYLGKYTQQEVDRFCKKWKDEIFLTNGW